MQRITLVCLWSLVATDSFKPLNFSVIQYSQFTTILIVFHSDKELTKIEHVHFGMVVCCVGLCLSDVDMIKKFLVSIQQDLDTAKDRGSSSSVRSYSLLLVNYRSTMALPTEPPYCLMYPRIYVMHPGSGEDPKLQNTLKNAFYRGGRAAN